MRLVIPCFIVVLAAVTLVVYHGAFGGDAEDNSRTGASPLDCGRNCAFELVYNTFNGDISGASAWDPSIPFSSQPGSSHI